MSIMCVGIMAIPAMEFSREGYRIRKVFGKKSTVVKWNDWILRIGVVASCQKLMLSKNVNNKKSAPKFVFFNEKKSERFGWFLTPPHYTNLQNSMISFDYSWFFAKNLSNLKTPQPVLP